MYFRASLFVWAGRVTILTMTAEAVKWAINSQPADRIGDSGLLRNLIQKIDPAGTTTLPKLKFPQCHRRKNWLLLSFPPGRDMLNWKLRGFVIVHLFFCSEDTMKWKFLTFPKHYQQHPKVKSWSITCVLDASFGRWVCTPHRCDPLPPSLPPSIPSLSALPAHPILPPLSLQSPTTYLGTLAP